MKQSKELYLRKIDIVRWGTPVTSQYGISAIPHLVLYDPRGQKVAEGLRDVLDYLKKIP